MSEILQEYMLMHKEIPVAQIRLDSVTAAIVAVIRLLNPALAYVENTTDTFANNAQSTWVKQIHKRVVEVKRSKEMEVEYMTLLQRDRENVELGIAKGKIEGKIEGETKLASLTEQLIEANRIIDMNKALKNKSYRETLYEEFGIQIINRPNQETTAAMMEAERIARDPSVKGYTDLDELFADLKA